jgi:VanZ family protein
VKRSALTLWGPFLLALAFVFYLSSLSEVPGARYFWDKLLHTVGYAGIGVLAMRAFHGGFGRPRLLPTILAGIAVVGWGISDEFHQSFVPGRDASALDVVADAVGFLTAVVILTIVPERVFRLGRPG